MENKDYSLEVKQELNSIKSLILTVSQRVQSLEESIEKIEKAQGNISSAQATSSSLLQPLTHNPINQFEPPNKSSESFAQTNNFQTSNLFIPNAISKTNNFDIESRIQPVSINRENNISSIKKFFSSFSFINVIGAFTVLLAVGILFKVAVDNGWIGPIFRLLMGFSFGALSILVGEYCQKREYKVASIGFIGLGQSILFLSTWFAKENFHFINQPTAFLAYIAITALIIAQSLRFNSQIIAILGVLGGFLAPVLASETGKGNFIIVGAYFLILVASIFYICSRTGWKAIKWLTFIVSYLFLILWCSGFSFLSAAEKAAKPDMQISVYLAFLFTFYTLYFGIAFFRSAIKGIKLNAFDITLIISNNVLALLLSLSVIPQKDHIYLGLAGLMIAAANVFVSNWLIKKSHPYQADINLFLSIAVALITISVRLIAPIKYVSIVWSIQAIILSLLAQKKDYSFLKFNFLAILFIVALRLMLVDEIFSSSINSITHKYNPLGLPTISGLISIATYFFCLRQYEGQYEKLEKTNSILSIFLWAGILFGSLICLSREAYGFSYSFMPNELAHTLHIGLLIAFGTIITWLFCSSNSNLETNAKILSKPKFVLLSIFVGFLSLMSLESIFDLVSYSRQELLTAHLVTITLSTILLVLFILSRQYRAIQKTNQNNQESQIRIFTTIIFAVGVVLLIGLIRREVYLFTYSIENRDIYQIVLSFSYSLAALGAYIWGLTQKDKPKIWIAMALFLFTGIKVYFVDLANLSQIYRGFSLLIFGSILLLASIIEQKINQNNQKAGDLS
jgi:uncharacterized membrane protein